METRNTNTDKPYTFWTVSKIEGACEHRGTKNPDQVRLLTQDMLLGTHNHYRGKGSGNATLFTRVVLTVTKGVQRDAAVAWVVACTPLKFTEESFKVDDKRKGFKVPETETLIDRYWYTPEAAAQMSARTEQAKATREANQAKKAADDRKKVEDEIGARVEARLNGSMGLDLATAKPDQVILAVTQGLRHWGAADLSLLIDALQIMVDAAVQTTKANEEVRHVAHGRATKNVQGVKPVKDTGIVTIPAEVTAMARAFQAAAVG